MKQYSILIVDDDKNIVDIYSIKFKSFGCEVNTATNIADAYVLIKNGLVPNAMLLDIIMPGGNGIELLNKIRKENLLSNTAVIILSNLDQRADMDSEFLKKIDGYFIKASVTPKDLVENILDILSKKNPQ